MKKFRLLIVVLGFLILDNTAIQAQDTLLVRPKIGLVLSGGGAKGFAHIPLLKLIDSLGIKVDYVTGTSMGSVVGGLYAVGYKGVEIEEMVHELKWDILLSNKLFLNEVNFEEKNEFGIYQAELPTTQDLKPKLPLGIIEGQSLLGFLTEKTFHVSAIHDFDSLPIPFRCMAADIISGEPVIIKSGFLPLALRSSMAIPTVFTPVDADTALLVDGGMVKNFPVSLAREMGAEIIIGGYTGGELYSKEQLTSFLKLLYQTTSFGRLEDSRNEMKLCDVLVNSNEYLNGFGAGDFNKFEAILRQGEIAARLQLPALIEIAKVQKAYDLQMLHVNKSVPPLMIDSIHYAQTGVLSEKLALGKFHVEEGMAYTASYLNSAINNVFGTRFFEKGYYQIERRGNKNHLILNAPENPPGALKAGLHYDNYQHAGVILNYTARNLLGNASRLMFTFDFAQNPKARLGYYKFLDKNMRYWVNSEVFFEQVQLLTYTTGKRGTQFVNRYGIWQTDFNYSISKSAAFGLGVGLEADGLKPFSDPLVSTNNAAVEIIDYELRRWNLTLRYQKNTSNLPNFATEGVIWDVSLKLIPNMFGKVDYLFTTDTAIQVPFDYTFEHVAKLRLTRTRFRQVAQKHVFFNTLNVGLTMLSDRDDNNLIAEGILETEKFWMGGPIGRPRGYYFTALGYHEFEYRYAQLIGWNLAWQWNPLTNFYITPMVNVHLVGNSISRFVNELDNIGFDMGRADSVKGAMADVGYGLKIGFDTRIGPIFIAVSNSVASPSLRYSWGFGFPMR